MSHGAEIAILCGVWTFLQSFIVPIIAIQFADLPTGVVMYINQQAIKVIETATNMHEGKYRRFLDLLHLVCFHVCAAPHEDADEE